MQFLNYIDLYTFLDMHILKHFLYIKPLFCASALHPYLTHVLTDLPRCPSGFLVSEKTFIPFT